MQAQTRRRRYRVENDLVIKGLRCIAGDVVWCAQCPYSDVNGSGRGDRCKRECAKDALALLKAQESITGETSDGYHTFNELYHHRAVLFSVIVANYPDRAWKSKKHHDGTMYNGMFIVGIDTPDGQATYHYDVDPYWDMFECRVLDNAPKWDGHTPAQAIERIGKLKAQQPRVLSAEELEHMEPGNVIWIERELLDHSRLMDYGMRIDTDDGPWFRTDDGGAINPMIPDEDYIRSRCWSAKPTDDQREATPWE